MDGDKNNGGTPPYKTYKRYNVTSSKNFFTLKLKKYDRNSIHKQNKEESEATLSEAGFGQAIRTRIFQMEIPGLVHSRELPIQTVFPG